jgi:hypothetical protein
MTRSAATWDLFFSGSNILKAITKELDGLKGLNTAAEIIWGGGSAGAVGSWLNIDWLIERYPSSRIVGLPDAGFFTEEPVYPGIAAGNPDQFRTITSQIWNSHVPPTCRSMFAAENISYCMMCARILLPFCPPSPKKSSF